jgi:hypothetical protein
MGMVGKAEVPENREVKERFVADMMRTKAERKEDKRGFYRKLREERRKMENGASESKDIH